MYRQLVSRTARPAVYIEARPVRIASRKLATPPPSQSAGKTPREPGSSNTLILLSTLGALGGLYYYYTRGLPAADREKARREEDEMKRRVRDIGEAGRSHAEGVAKQGQREYEQVKASVQDGVAAARGRAAEARTDATERARQSAHDAQAKFDGLKNTTERKIRDARDSSEKIFEDGKEEIAREAHDAEKKARGWFGWGSSK